MMPLFTLPLFIALAQVIAADQDIIGCGGFVQSSVPINFDKVHVKLFTKQGAFKFTTECAPNNGYFLVAVYDKGEYVLRIEPPSGWGFSPKEIKLSIDGSTDPCSKGEDLNFKFTGFTVSGSVGSVGQEEGPSGVAVALSNDGDDKLLETTSQQSGSFQFEDVMPGEYVITAGHKTWSFLNNKVQVEVTNNNIESSKELIVSGYDVKGSVVSGGEPIQGVFFILFSAKVQRKDIGSCEDIPPEMLQHVDIAEKPLCQVTSNEKGEFLYPSIPSGDYVLVPFYTAQNNLFDVVPSKLAFPVASKSVFLKTPFQVYGFSVAGKVVDGLGMGLAGVKISVSNDKADQRFAKTDDNGDYRLENVTTGNYNVVIKKENYFFEDETFYITPNSPTLPTISAKKYSICGKIEISQLPSGVLPVNQRKITLQPSGAQNTEITSMTADPAGKFCFIAPPGKFKIEVMVSSNEMKKGFLMKPKSLEVEVISHPISNIIFQQFRAKVMGKMTCIGSCEDAVVYMTTTEKAHPEKVYANVQNAGTNESHFQFDQVLPGKYKIVASKKKWCWKGDEEVQYREVHVTDSDVEDVKFVHDGYFLKCTISHNISLKFVLENHVDEVGSFDLSFGTNRFCLKLAGVYRLTPESCYKFEQSTYRFDTAAPASLDLSVVGYKLRVDVKSEKRIGDLMINVRSPAGKQEMLTTTSVDGPDNNTFLYEAFSWGKLSDSYTVRPVSNEVLFKPEESATTIQGTCPGAAVGFLGEEGKFIEGSISPPLIAVAVTIQTKGPASRNQARFTVLSDKNGEYKFGPIHKDIEYDLTASKDGYSISPAEAKDSFVALMLSKITVKVHEEIQKPSSEGVEKRLMSSVLLSLSGGQYRKNNLTTDGAFEFSDLRPGQYFLRPMKKEYSFDPNSKIIEVAEGQDLTVVVKGNRVAFSCHGMTSSLSGIPEENVIIQAIGLDHCSQYHEETTSDMQGQFRLRGLEPNCSYSVQMSNAESNSHIERFAPVKRIVKVEQDDISGVNFIVFQKSNTFTLTGVINTTFELLPSLKVFLYEEENLESPVHTIVPGLVKFIQFPPLKRKNYVVKLETSLSLKTHDIKTSSVTVAHDGSPRQHVVLAFYGKERLLDIEPTQSVWTLPFAVALIFICYNYDTALLVIMWMNKTIQNFNRKEESESGTESEDDVSKSMKKKRR